MVLFHQNSTFVICKLWEVPDPQKKGWKDIRHYYTIFFAWATVRTGKILPVAVTLASTASTRTPRAWTTTITRPTSKQTAAGWMASEMDTADKTTTGKSAVRGPLRGYPASLQCSGALQPLLGRAWIIFACAQQERHSMWSARSAYILARNMKRRDNIKMMDHMSSSTIRGDTYWG